MTEVEGSRISPALHKFLEETDEDGEGEPQAQDPEELSLGVLDITTTETSLRGAPIGRRCPSYLCCPRRQTHDLVLPN